MLHEYTCVREQCVVCMRVTCTRDGHASSANMSDQNFLFRDKQHVIRNRLSITSSLAERHMFRILYHRMYDIYVYNVHRR